MSHNVNSNLPMTRISTRKSIEVQPSSKHSDADTEITVTTGRHDRRKQTLKTILRDEAPVFLSHEEVVVSSTLKKGRKSSKNRQKSEDLRPPLKGGLIETKTRCIQVTEEVGKALRTGAWQNRKEEIRSLSCRNKPPKNCDSDVMSVDSTVSRKRVNTNLRQHKESTHTMLSKVRENRKASRCCAECKSVVFDREKLRLRGSLGVKICDTCWSKKKPKEVHVTAQPVVPRGSSPTVKKCLVKLFDVSRYPVGHPFGKGFQSQRSLKRRRNESHAVDDTASEIPVQPKRARKSGSSTFSAEFVNTPKAKQLKDSKQIGHANDTGSKERSQKSRNVSHATTDVIISNKNDRSYRRKSNRSTTENAGQEKLLKVNAQTISRKNSGNAETTTTIRTSRRSSSNNETASDKKILRKNSLNSAVPSEKGMTQKSSDNAESPLEKKSEKSGMNAETSSERKSRRSSMNAEIPSQKKTPQRSGMNVETAVERRESRRSIIKAEIAGAEKTSRRSSTSTETTPARVSRRISVNAETTSEIRILRRSSSSNETSGARPKQGNRISNKVSKSALPVRIQSKNKTPISLSRTGQTQLISSAKSKSAVAKLDSRSDKNTSKIQLTQIKSVKLGKALPGAAVVKSSHTNKKKKQLIPLQNKQKTAIPLTSRKGSVLPKYSKPAEKVRAKSVLKRKTGIDVKNRKSLARGDSSKKSAFGKLRAKVTTVRHVNKSSINTLKRTPLSEKTAASRKRKMDIPDKPLGVKKRKIESLPVRRKQAVVEKEFTRSKNLHYECDICNKKYRSLAEERLHELSHTGRQPVLVLHKCDSPQGVLSLIREDDFSSLNICSSDSEIQKDVTCEMHMSCDGSNMEVNMEADIGTVQMVEGKDEDTDATQLENLENTDEETVQSISKSFEMVETEEVVYNDHVESIPFDNCDTSSVLKTKEIECSQQMIHSDTDVCPSDKVDKNETDSLLENTNASKVQAESLKESSVICSPELAKKPKSSDEIAVLLEEIFGESSEEDLISVTGIRNLRQAADAVNSSIDKTSEFSKEKPPCGVNSPQHTSVTQNLGTAVPKFTSSDTTEAVSQYLKGDMQNPEEILHQMNYGDKTFQENEAETNTKTSRDTDQADTNIKPPVGVELNNRHKTWESEGGSPEISSVTEGEEVTAFDDDDGGNRVQLVDKDSKTLEIPQAHSPDETVHLINEKEDASGFSTDNADNRNQTLKDSTHVNEAGENNVLEDKTSDDIPIKVDISFDGNKDSPNSVSKDISVMKSVNGTVNSEGSCKQSQNEAVNEDVGHHNAHLIGSTETSPEHMCKADNGDKHNISVLTESQTDDQEKQVILDTTSNSVIHKILENHGKCYENELQSDICHDQKTMLECHKKVEGNTETIVNLEQVDTKPVEIVDGDGGGNIKAKIIVQKPECADDTDPQNKLCSNEVSECIASEKCPKNTSVCFVTFGEPENETRALGEKSPQTDLVTAGSNESEVSSTKDSLENILQNEICEDEVGTSDSGLIKDVLLVGDNEADEMLDSASADIVSGTETDNTNIAVHSPSEAVTEEAMEIDSSKSDDGTAPKMDEHNCHKYVCDSSEVKDTEMDLLVQPDSVCDPNQEIDSSQNENIQDTTCDVSSLKLDQKIVASDSGHNIDHKGIPAILDSGPEVQIDKAEHGVKSPDSDHNVEAMNTSHETENVLQPETLNPENKLQILNPNDDLKSQVAGQKIQTVKESNEIQVTNDTNTKDDYNPCTDHDADNSARGHQPIEQDSSKEGTPVDANQRAVGSTNVKTKEGPSCEREPLVGNFKVDKIEKSDEVEDGIAAQDIGTTGSSCGTHPVVTTCDDKTDDANCEVETEDVNHEVVVEKTSLGVETASADHEVAFISVSEDIDSEVASDEVVVALDANSEADALIHSDEAGAEVQFVPSSDLSTNSEITAGISDCCPSLVGVENLSFNVRHTVPDVFEEEAEILQEDGDHSILQEENCADSSVETSAKGQNEMQEKETEDSVKSPLVVGLNGMKEKVTGECSTKVSGDNDAVLKDNLHLAVSEDNDISGLEPISDDELDFI